MRDFMPTTQHYRSEGLDTDINNNLSERLQDTYKDRIKALRGLDSLETGQRYLDGWVFTYNHFRGDESLRNAGRRQERGQNCRTRNGPT